MRLLIVSPYFAPSSLVGAQRMTSFAKYMADHGHEIHVIHLTAETMQRTTGNSCHSTPPENIILHPFDLPEEVPNVFANELNKGKAFDVVFEQVLESYEFDGLLVTLGPFYPLYSLKKFMDKYKLPYILDFRDLGSIERIKKDTLLNYIKTSMNELYAHHVEATVIKGADYVTVVCPGDVGRMQKAYKIPDDKISCVFNGFDEERTRGVKLQTAAPTEKPFKIGVFGKFMIYNKDKGPLILRAVDRLRKEGHDVQIVHVGVGQDDVRQTIAEMGVDPACYDGRGILDYKDGVQVMSGCNMFAMDYVHPTGLGTKIFDYIHLNRPVLVVAPDHIYFAEFISQFKNCFRVDAEQEIYDAIKKVITEQISILDDHMNADAFSRRHQNKRFEALVKQHLHQNHSEGEVQ